MTRDKLLDVLWQVYNHEILPDVAMTAVEAYSSASNGAKPIVSGALPPDEEKHDCEKEGHYEDCNSGCCLFCGVKFIDRNFDNDD